MTTVVRSLILSHAHPQHCVVVLEAIAHSKETFMGMFTSSGRARGARVGTLARWTLLAFGAFLLGWLAWAAVSWVSYGHGSRTAAADSEVRRFLPDYEVEELFQARINAPAPLTFAAAESMSLNASPLIRGIFRARELLLGATPSGQFPSGGVVEQMRSMGWGVLSAAPEREIVLGAVTQPWNRDVVFRALPPEEFAGFHGPGFVKIVVTIGADPIDSATSRLRIGTYVATTDPVARARFRRYWAVFSPGILLIRAIALNEVKHEAERRYRMLDSRRVAAERNAIDAAPSGGRVSAPPKSRSVR